MSQSEPGSSRFRNCGNPLLCEWLEEWMEKAQGIQSKAYFAYKKAYASMLVHPTPFQHPSEAEKLHGIGKGLALKLEKRMTAHCKANGIPMPERVKPSGKRNHDQISTGTQGDGEVSESSQSRPRQKRKQSTYVPRFRSGAYAIMLTLYESEESGINRLSKEEIVAAGQKYCDSSFDMAEAGRGYTAWVSIKTLLEKGYVWKQSSPPRYSLTDTGKAMAEQLARASGKGSQRSQMASASEPSTSTNLQSSQPDSRQEDERTTPLRIEPVLEASVIGTPSRHPIALTTSSATQISSRSIQPSQQEPYVISSDEDETDLINSGTILLAHDENEVILSDITTNTNKAATTSDVPRFEQFWYTYLDGEGQHVSKSRNAAIHVDDMNFSILYKIKYHTSQESHSFASNVKMTNAIGNGFACGFLKEHVADSSCPGLGPHDIPTTPNKPISVHTLQVSALRADIEDDGQPGIQELSSDDLWTLQYEPEAYSQKSATDYAASEYDDVLDANNSQNLTQQSQISNTSAYANSQPLSQLDPGAATLSQMSAPETTRDFSAIQCRSYPPGSFEVVLVLDSREIKSRRDRDYMRDMLHQRNVTVDVRSLELGDAIWVARQCTDDGPVDELFLDMVLERKRMDDLVSSIKDGRFKEQKYRLKKSAAKQVFYVIEEFNMDEAIRFGQQAVQTALASTQVVDGFFVKHTASIDETIDYLERLTNALKKDYEAQEIFEIPSSAVDKSDYMALKKHYRTNDPDGNYLITSNLYAQLNSKSGTLTLEDMFAKFLLNIRGVSSEKAYELKKIYRTPHQLMQAFDTCVDCSEEQNLAKDATKASLPRRRWGPSLSRKLWDIWRSQEYKN
ncbi:hypothetical protein K450DRAFT_262153 [Umbelopsis ramanniana AG]|uniref:Crossover junction endonuclease MUS81 n=1 Tax=Umbelopsis ramanniana AG TaxID=1314678 RepID=A0AAD5E2Q5_UMBRA|nr:uncharacterized protein K450DRAFT_262153 [Umbelopsis ramanniana AG]KAI8575381.1 hypothetical protein K450DRAFT_262153 [Umbelopsis ramanniana AG]